MSVVQCDVQRQIRSTSLFIERERERMRDRECEREKECRFHSSIVPPSLVNGSLPHTGLREFTTKSCIIHTCTAGATCSFCNANKVSLDSLFLTSSPKDLHILRPANSGRGF